MHTPGPWIYSIRSDFAEIAQPGGLTVASLSLRLLDINTSIADAMLIAAAPDLLAACELWDKGFTEGEEFTPEQLLEWMNKNRRAAREAIAKAKVAR